MFRASIPSRAKEVFIRGWGQIKINTNDEEGRLIEMAKETVSMALEESGLSFSDVSSFHVGNMIGNRIDSQYQMAAYLSHKIGLKQANLDCTTIDAASGSGGAAIRSAFLSLLSGAGGRVAVVLGLERMMGLKDDVTRALAGASDWIEEGSKGETFVSLNGFLQNMYISKYNLPSDCFYPFAKNAHQNAFLNPHALFANKLVTKEAYLNSKILVEPYMRIYDAAPVCNGAAALVLSLEPNPIKEKNVVIRGSSSATDNIHLEEREDPLHLEAVKVSAHSAASQAGIDIKEIDLIEVHDAFAGMAALSLESMGLVKRGEATLFARDGGIFPSGKYPIAISGGLKARGHPIGASGVYQACDVAEQISKGGVRIDPLSLSSPLRPVQTALIQSVGGCATSVISHVLSSP